MKRSTSFVARFSPLAILFLGALVLAAPLFQKAKSEFDIAGFGRIPVVANGRTKPLDSVARNTLLLLQGRQRVVTPDGVTLSPTAWLLDVFFRPERADTYRHFEIVNPELLDVFGITTEDGDGGKRFSYQQLIPKLEELDRQAGLAQSVETPQRNAYQRAVLNLRDHVILYQQLKHSLVMPDGSDFLGDLLYLQDNLAAGIAAVRAKENDKNATDSEVGTRTMEMGAKFLRMQQIGFLLTIPPSTPDGKWTTTGESLLNTFQNGAVNVHALAFAGLQRTWKNQDPEHFNELITRQRSEFATQFASVLKKTDAETTFNRAEPFYSAMYLYVGAFLLAVGSLLIWQVSLQRAAYYLIALAWIATTAGIIARMWLEGRPPVTNLYSSALFVGWGSVGLCLILERIFRNGIGCVAAGLTGFCTLLIAHHLSLSGDTLEMMRAVLDSNFWLATHVVIITIGYSATYLAGFLALLYVIMGVFTTWLDKKPTGQGNGKDSVSNVATTVTAGHAVSAVISSAASAQAKRSDTNGQMLGRMVYGIICFATLFSLVGTILGGIWADQSWGRFWGWDPKENGALIIVIWNAIILHARWGGIARTRGIMALAIFGNIVTSWSWFGTNMLNVGLHSYGFMDQAFVALVAFGSTQLVLIGLTYLPKEKWRSVTALK